MSLFGWTLPGVLKCVCVRMCGCSISLACTRQFVLLYLSGCVTFGSRFLLVFCPPPPDPGRGTRWPKDPKIARSRCRSSRTAAPTTFRSGLTSSQPETFSFFGFDLSFVSLIRWSLFGPSLRFYCPLTNYILFCQVLWVFLFHFLWVLAPPVFPPFIPPWPSGKLHKVFLGTCSARPSSPQECAVVHVNITRECDKSASAFAAATQSYQEKTVEKWGRDLSLFLFPLGFKIRPELSDHKWAAFRYG